MPEKTNFWSRVVGDKRRWHQYRARVGRLPANYRTAVGGVERYLMRFGPTDADSAASLLEDVADLFEQAAAHATPVREVVGEDPVEFVDALIRNYTSGGWVAKEQQRLIHAIDEAAGDR
ncbi:MAG: DUF1048 domain-containing protein [Candidatus Nanopelagicales bacterium]